ncbi:hypothetical protein DFA_01160 [Cavenderia fasciculata]|uniref:Uncharacterized protein n=1 Tax=Cavenderia fasciculata TaxID=261658 RepID=F4PR79_CACFS|nr:uncharacterized protein DFA_01160 [Cavenderia fasciculata]EGG21279.1 hypothetical protein DFA_01160 [Cavenderia fasciculata]|eukprot:XP_004359129.1 hypothetical protein DFA_01160 [Cavenderia fasciculata]
MGGGHQPFHVAKHHKYISVALGTTMWFWVFYRAKQDWRSFLGLEFPWDHGHGHHIAPKNNNNHDGGHH